MPLRSLSGTPLALTCLAGLAACTTTGAGGAGYSVGSQGYATQLTVRQSEAPGDARSSHSQRVWSAWRDVTKLSGYAGYEDDGTAEALPAIILMRAGSVADAQDKVDAMSLRPGLFGVRVVGPSPPERNPAPLPEGRASELMEAAVDAVPGVYESYVRGGVVHLGVASTREAFRSADIPARFRDHSSIRYTFLPVDLDAPAIHRSAEGLLRTYETSKGFSGIVATSLTTGYLRLQDGCILMGRRDGPGGRRTAVVLPKSTGVRVRGGFVELYRRLFPEDYGTRLGQTMGWGDGTRKVARDDPRAVRLRRRCGAATTVSIGHPSPYDGDFGN